MKKCWILIVVSIYFISSNSCNHFSEGGMLYITDDTCDDTEIVTLKILKQSQNQLSGDNSYLNYKDEIIYKGNHWFVYDIPSVSLDVYIEYYKKGVFYNLRENIIINYSDSEVGWIAIWLIDDKNIPVKTVHGFGKLSIKENV